MDFFKCVKQLHHQRCGNRFGNGFGVDNQGAKIGAFNELRNQVPVAAVLADIANSDDALMGYSAQGSVFGEETEPSAPASNLHHRSLVTASASKMVVAAPLLIGWSSR